MPSWAVASMMFLVNLIGLSLVALVAYACGKADGRKGADPGPIWGTKNGPAPPGPKPAASPAPPPKRIGPWPGPLPPPWPTYCDPPRPRYDCPGPAPKGVWHVERLGPRP